MAQEIPPLGVEAYRLVFEANPHPILLFEMGSWRILAANDAAARLYGWSTAELTRMTVLDIRPAEERKFFLKQVPALPEAITHLGHAIHQARDGRIIHVQITTGGLMLEDGTRARISVITDVTDSRRLQEARDRLAAIVAGSHDAIILTDLKGRIQSWNPGAERIFGYTEAEMRGRSISVIHPPGKGPGFREMAAEVLAGCAVRLFDVIGRHKDGRDIIVSLTLSPTCNDAGEVIGVSGIERDVTERREAERALKESEARFARIFNSPLILACVIDVRGRRIRDINEAWLQFFGLARDEVVGAPIEALGRMWLDERQRDAIFSTWTAGAPIQGVEAGFRTKGGQKYALLSVHHAPDDGEDLVVMVDITARRQLEAQLSESRRLEALGQIVGGVAHDFNNMLSVMLGYAELLEQQLPKGGPLHRDVQEIKRAADRAADLTRQLLAFGRRQVLQRSTVDLNTVVAGAETLLSHMLSGHATLRFELADEALWVNADVSQLEQVLLNLTSNARDALEGAGVVTIATRARRLARAWAQERGLAPGLAAELSVRDTGRGMDVATLLRIFEPFFTTKGVGEGTGLGLATVYGIVKQSGGDVEASSTPGRGSLFRVVLPLVESPASTGS